MIEPIDKSQLDMWEAKAIRCAEYLNLAKQCIKQCMPGPYSDDRDIERPVSHIITQINDLQFSVETILGNIQYRKQCIKEVKQ